ncbi:MAG TPA: helix-turn-helix domain-containing protein [Devosiaceae bacterium]|jgi:DNA-binding transcriptional ArsR family regulator
MSDVDRNLVFGALADPNRRLVLERLRERNGQSLADLSRGLPISRQAVNKHLIMLEEANLITSAREGRCRLHFLNPVPIHATAIRWLERFAATELGILAEVGAGSKKAGH